MLMAMERSEMSEAGGEGGEVGERGWSRDEEVRISHVLESRGTSLLLD